MGPRLVAAVAIIVLVVAMALDTKVVWIGSDEDVRQDVFSPEAFGKAHFPDIQANVESRAVDAAELAAAIAEDKQAAAKKYGVAAGIGAVIPIQFTGVVAGDAKGGIYQVKIAGVPEHVTVRMQTGPAINGTDLRDATGEITFGQFTNQIEFQNAGAALNTQMKLTVLSNLDVSDLNGKTVSVIGVFKLINPKNWLVTPVRMSVR